METRVSGRGAPQRPLSPHLQVYAFPINMAMSILHRVTGAALYFGTMFLLGLRIQDLKVRPVAVPPLPDEPAGR